MTFFLIVCGFLQGIFDLLTGFTTGIFDFFLDFCILFGNFHEIFENPVKIISKYLEFTYSSISLKLF